MRCKFKFISIALFAGVFLMPCGSANAADAVGFLDGIAQNYLSASQSWSNEILYYARRLFYLLATITFVWQFVPLALSGFKGDIGDVFSPVMRWIITTGFFYWLLMEAPSLAESIVGSFAKIGSDVSGQYEIGPSGIINTGMFVVGYVGEALNNADLKDIPACLAALLIALMIACIMVLIAAELTIILCGAYIMAYAGVIVVGFGGSSFTRDMAIGYFKHMLGVGLHVMTLYLVVGLGEKEVRKMAASLVSSSGALPILSNLVAVAVSSLILYVLAKRIPPMVASLSGTGGTNGLGSGVTAGAAMGVAKMAAGAAVGMAATQANQLISGGSLISQLKKAVNVGGAATPSAEITPSLNGNQAGGDNAIHNQNTQSESVMPLPGQEKTSSAAPSSGVSTGSKVWAGAKTAGSAVKTLSSAVGGKIIENANRQTMLGKASNAIKQSTVAQEKEIKLAEDEQAINELKEQLNQFNINPQMPEDADTENNNSGGTIMGGK